MFYSTYALIELYYDNGLSGLTYEDLKQGKVTDFLMIGLPLFLSGILLGSSFCFKSQQTNGASS